MRRELFEEPEVLEAEEAPSRKWTFGVAAGALLVAGTFAAGALGINGNTMPLAGTAPEHAPASPGNAPYEPGTPPVQAAPPVNGDGGREDGVEPQATQPTAAPSGEQAPVDQAPAPGSGHRGGAPAPAPAPAPDPAPQPDPTPQPPPQQQPNPGGGGGGLLDPITGVVGGVLDPIVGGVGGILSPSSTAASTAGDQPAMTMIDPLGDLLGG